MRTMTSEEFHSAHEQQEILTGETDTETTEGEAEDTNNQGTHNYGATNQTAGKIRPRTSLPKNIDGPAFGHVWSALVPGTAIFLQTTFKNALDGIFGAHQCTGTPELVLRTVTFGISAMVGLANMKWKDFNDDTPLFIHHVFNVLLIFSWLFAISDFPLLCYINLSEKPTEDEEKIIDAIRMIFGICAPFFVTYVESQKPIQNIQNNNVQFEHGEIV